MQQASMLGLRFSVFGLVLGAQTRGRSALSNCACPANFFSLRRRYWPSARLSKPVPQAAIDSLVTREMQARRIPGVAIAVVDHGNIIFKKAYGIANLEHHDSPVTVNSVFGLASVTKQFTAAAIMLLVEEGKVRICYYKVKAAAECATSLFGSRKRGKRPI